MSQEQLDRIENRLLHLQDRMDRLEKELYKYERNAWNVELKVMRLEVINALEDLVRKGVRRHKTIYEIEDERARKPISPDE